LPIEIARTDDQIAACLDVMVELRTSLERDEFVARVRRQEREGFTLAYVTDADSIAAVAGFRVCECLADGRVLYVDDLVTRSSSRSRGFGKRSSTGWSNALARSAAGGSGSTQWFSAFARIAFICAKGWRSVPTTSSST
jgi:hypothetical protein